MIIRLRTSCNNRNPLQLSRILFSEPPILREDEFTNIREVANEKIRLRVKRELRKKKRRSGREERIFGQSFSNKFFMYCD